MPYEADTIGDGSQRGRLHICCAWWCGTEPQEPKAEKYGDSATCLNGVNQFAAADCQQCAGQRGAAYGSQFLHTAVPCHRVAQDFRGHNQRQCGQARGALKCARGGGKEQTGVNQQDGTCAESQHGTCRDEHHLAEQHCAPAVVAVGDVAGEKRKQQKRDYLDQAHVAENGR